jgi:hypothetical protein
MSALTAHNLEKGIGQGREADYSPKYNTEVKKGEAVSPLRIRVCLHGIVLN